MSRAVVKQLPGDWNNADLAAQFKNAGFPVTDAKVLRKRDGTPRRMGFVGFKTPELTEKAVQYMNNVWVQGGRLVVELAQEADKELLNRPAKKRKLVHQSVETLTATSSTADNTQDDVQDENMTDAEYLAKRRKRTLSDRDNDKDKDESVPIEEETEKEEDPFANGRLFLRNLAFDISPADLEEYFKSVGQVVDVKLPTSNQGGQQRGTGIGYVAFKTSAEAKAAFEQLDGKPLLGRLLHIMPSIDRAGFKEKQKAAAMPLTPSEIAAKSKTFDKHLNRHDDTRANHDDTLVLNTDTIVSTLAKNLGLQKSDILDHTSSFSAVRLAQAETSLVNATIEHFAAHGADLRSLATSSSGSQKHATTLLITNLPANSAETTIRALVSRFGKINKMIVPASSTIAVVDMATPDELQEAIEGLSYQKMGNSVLYVKRVPAQFWTAPTSKANDEDTNTTMPDETQSAPSDTLFVQNVAFSTTQDAFARAFSHLPGFSYARLVASKGYGFLGFNSTALASTALKKHVNGYLLDGRPLTAGFAKSTTKGTKKVEETEDIALDDGSVANGKNKTAKLLVKNVPFEASINDLKALFATYGTIKTVRLPKRADKRSRGFAFVEYATNKEADYAMKMLKDTHLFGRHLVLEPVKQNSMEDLLA